MRLRIALGLSLCATLAGCDSHRSASAALPAREAAELHLHVRADALPDRLLADFEKETGIRTQVHFYETDQELALRLERGRSGYDLVVARAAEAQPAIEAGLLRPLDRGALSGTQTLDPRVMTALSTFDAGNRHLVPWALGFVTVAIDRARAQGALGGLPIPDDAWALVFDPTRTSRLRGCGIVFTDAATRVLPAALHALKRELRSTASQDLDAAARLLERVRPDVAGVVARPADALAEGRACVALGMSHEFNVAAAQLRERKSSRTVETLLAGGGAPTVFDVMAIPVDAPRPGNAHRFIDFVLRPAQSLALAAELGMAPGNPAARQLAGEALAYNASLFLPAGDTDTIVPLPRGSDDAVDAAERVYATFRQGVASNGAKPRKP